MRILYLVTSLGVGGAERQTIALAERMAARGHTVALLTLKHVEEELPVRLPVLRLNLAKTPFGIQKGLRFAAGFLAAFRADVVHSHTFPANIFARLLRRQIAGEEHLPVMVNTIHNIYEGGWHRRLLYRLSRRWVDSVTAVSAAAADAHARGTGMARDAIAVVVNGIETDEYRPDEERRGYTRSLMGAGENFIWLAVGRLAPGKDYPNLLRAWLAVRKEFKTARLWIAGEGEAEAQADAAALDEAEREGVEWLGLRRDVRDLLDAADGYVLSSAWEGMPLAVAEAMAMGKPVAATRVGGVVELVGDAGLLVEANSSDALAYAMRTVMLMKEEERFALGIRAQARVQDRFSMSAAVDAWESLYASLAEQTIS
ncbi:MAG TPA: glycosyltransferase [Acidobacteriaceae bacterium]|nr:glycosyltransferase [Acidobacteriaceae bacterium]